MPNKKSSTPLHIEMYNGKLFEWDNPEFDIKDIAWSLSGMPRFGARPRLFYNGALHAILVARLNMHFGGNPKEGMTHDMPEAFLMDVPTPWKSILPDYNKLESKFYRRIAKWAGVPPTISKLTKHSDRLALFLEADALMPSKGKNFDGYDKFHPEVIKLKQLGIAPKMMSREESYNDFLRWWKRCQESFS